MQIKNIILYNYDGDHRELKFNINSLNIITGKSRTGKSAIINIIDYCMGRSTFDVFDGVNRDVISWYAVTYKFKDKEILIAKQPPKNGKASSSEVCIFIGESISIPKFADLHINTNDNGVTIELGKELNLKENLTFRTELDDGSYDANLKHAKSFIFQEQGEIADKKNLFHRQDEAFRAQAIKDTFPFFLGAMDNDRLYTMQILKDKKSVLRKQESLLKQLNGVISDSNEKAVQLLNEASNIGLVDSTLISNELEFNKCIELLKECSNWNPEEVRKQSKDDLYLLQSQLSDFQKNQVELKEKLSQTRLFEKHHNSHVDDIIEHKARLMPIELFDSTKGLSCPLCGVEGHSDSPKASQVISSLNEVRDQLSLITQSSPKLTSYVNELSSEENELQIKIDDYQVKIRTIIKYRKENNIIKDRNVYVSKVLGRISLFLESVVETEPDSDLLHTIKNLKHDISILEEELSTELVKEKVDSVLNIVGSFMGAYAKELNLEYADSPYRLDLAKLTVFADTPRGAIPMHRQGSGENWLGCHVITFLALHKYFSEHNCPVPSFFILDQPSQVHFPDLQAYKKLGGDLINYTDIDMQEVRNLFKLFYSFCNASSNGFQIIVTEHANLEEDWFQSSLVEAPWKGNNALIPYAWINTEQK